MTLNLHEGTKRIVLLKITGPSKLVSTSHRGAHIYGKVRFTYYSLGCDRISIKFEFLDLTIESMALNTRKYLSLIVESFNEDRVSKQKI